MRDSEGIGVENELVCSVSDFVALLNQTMEFAYPSVLIVGEIANFRVSKGKWVYFDLKDDQSSVKFFGTIYQLPGPLEDGMMLQVRGVPRLHNLYGFSVNVQFMQPVGEGSLKKAADLLLKKLEAEGLFDSARKRALPYPPQKIGLISSGESAAYHDFMKILHERWSGIEVLHADVQVQGEAAIGQIVSAIQYFNTHADDVEVLVVTRGGGSADDLAAFSTEQVTRAVAGSRIPTIVAIGHEVDVSLAELAADQRASTPSNAAQLLVPDKVQTLQTLAASKAALNQGLLQVVKDAQQNVRDYVQELRRSLQRTLEQMQNRLRLQSQLLQALSPTAALQRGYAIVRSEMGIARSAKGVQTGDVLHITFSDGSVKTEVKEVEA